MVLIGFVYTFDQVNPIRPIESQEERGGGPGSGADKIGSASHRDSRPPEAERRIKKITSLPIRKFKWHRQSKSEANTKSEKDRGEATSKKLT